MISSLPEDPVKAATIIVSELTSDLYLFSRSLISTAERTPVPDTDINDILDHTPELWCSDELRLKRRVIRRTEKSCTLSTEIRVFGENCCPFSRGYIYIHLFDTNDALENACGAPFETLTEPQQEMLLCPPKNVSCFLRVSSYNIQTVCISHHHLRLAWDHGWIQVLPYVEEQYSARFFSDAWLFQEITVQDTVPYKNALLSYIRVSKRTRYRLGLFLASRPWYFSDSSSFQERGVCVIPWRLHRYSASDGKMLCKVVVAVDTRWNCITPERLGSQLLYVDCCLGQISVNTSYVVGIGDVNIVDVNRPIPYLIRQCVNLASELCPSEVLVRSLLHETRAARSITVSIRCRLPGITVKLPDTSPRVIRIFGGGVITEDVLLRVMWLHRPTTVIIASPLRLAVWQYWLQDASTVFSNSTGFLPFRTHTVTSAVDLAEALAMAPGLVGDNNPVILISLPLFQSPEAVKSWLQLFTHRQECRFRVVLDIHTVPHGLQEWCSQLPETVAYRWTVKQLHVPSTVTMTYRELDRLNLMSCVYLPVSGTGEVVFGLWYRFVERHFVFQGLLPLIQLRNNQSALNLPTPLYRRHQEVLLLQKIENHLESIESWKTGFYPGEPGLISLLKEYACDTFRDDSLLHIYHQSAPSTFPFAHYNATLLRHTGPVTRSQRSNLLTCAICLEEELDQHFTVTTTCNHTFHYNCLSPWLSQNAHQSCPLCRNDYCDFGSSLKISLPRYQNELYYDANSDRISGILRHLSQLIQTYEEQNTSLRVLVVATSVSWLHHFYSRLQKLIREYSSPQTISLIMHDGQQTPEDDVAFDFLNPTSSCIAVLTADIAREIGCSLHVSVVYICDPYVSEVFRPCHLLGFSSTKETGAFIIEQYQCNFEFSSTLTSHRLNHVLWASSSWESVLRYYRKIMKENSTTL